MDFGAWISGYGARAGGFRGKGDIMQSIKDVVIVGGGASGWLSALHLRAALGPDNKVTVIESPNVPTIGVGEGTQPTIRQHFASLSIDEREVFRRCGASYKNGIRFVGWRTGAAGDEYLHPFFSGPSAERNSPVAPHQVWLAHHADPKRASPPMAEALWAESRLIRERKAPIAHKDGAPLAKPVANYACHVDAALLGAFLRETAIGRGVRHIRDDVTDVALLETGGAPRIGHVQTRAHGAVAADFFLDCTGFHRVLHAKLAPRDRFVSYAQHLLNDRAVAARIPYPEGAPRALPSCTTSTALPHGWLWQVPLYRRLGAGYVYSSAFVSDDAAEAAFRAFVKAELGLEVGDARRIRFQTGRLERAWVGNCCAVGLSAGFIEPLEATGVALLTYQLHRLLEFWPDVEMAPALAERFNALMAASFDWVRDFVVMHYCFSERADTEYWRAVARREHIPESLREAMALLDRRWPFGDMMEPKAGFRLPGESVAAVLAGFGRFPSGPSPYAAAMPRAQVAEMFQTLTRRNAAIAAACPDHATFLRTMNGDAPRSSTAA